MRRPRIAVLAAAALAGALVTWIVTADRIPELTAGRLDQARERWASASYPSYRLSLETEGSELQDSRFEITVREGQAPVVVHDGLAATGDGAMYTVAGLFEILAREMALAEEPSRSFGAPAGYRAYLFASFDETRGYPLRYRRVVGGSKQWIEWAVRDLQPLP